MSLDLVLRNARVVGSSVDAPLQDIGIAEGRIAAIEAGLPDGGESLDVAGGLVSGGLIETSTSRAFSTVPSRHPTAVWTI